MATKRFTTKNFTVEVTGNKGWFEHNTLGDECGGGLWFCNTMLEDMDGVAFLPSEVAQVLRDNGYVVSSDFTA